MTPSRNPADIASEINISSFKDFTNDDSRNALTASAHAQVLLQAMQNYIVPLVNAHDQHRNDARPILLGTEAGKFLTALQNFVSSIIHSQSYSADQSRIDVNLNDDEYENQKDLVHSQKSENSSTPGQEDGEVSGQLEQTHKRKPLERILAVLRERIFNTMPIRLLHAVPHGSKLRIRLLERSEVYAHLASQLEANFADTESLFRSSQLTSASEADERERILINSWVSSYAKYAILSHTWIREEGGEVTYSDWSKGAFDGQQLGYRKLVNFCKAAWKHHGLVLGWMDTICINKESSSELDESIRSMYKWYKNATVCITYLAGTRELADMHRDPWFTRGWTFQELLAPQITKFYNMDWEKVIDSESHNPDKDDSRIQRQIHQATTITFRELATPQFMPISRKMQLAAKREVMREEDSAYSLMGICGVSISIAYGEGAKRAFARLMTEIMNSSHHVLDIFNCAQHSDYSIIPSTSSAYLHRSQLPLENQRPIEPLILTHLGVRVPILLMPSLQEDNPRLENDPIGDYHATVTMKQDKANGHSGTCFLLDKGLGIKSRTQDGLTWTFETRTYNIIFGVLNFGGDTTNVILPGTCLALRFWSLWNAEWESNSTLIERHNTEEPIVFKLLKRNTHGDFEHEKSGHIIKRRELKRHGMKIVTMYL